ncbi:MAG: hypothetical protein M0R70_07820 [Nitrospirae bacterium]|nr:hypothetical protein [Nitrospirota bacterium]
MKIMIRILLATAFLIAGFAAGFPAGKSAGFTSGSEWALVQANIVAREAGVFMPVSLYEGEIRVVIKQPRHLYKRAWELADKNENEMRRVNRGERSLSKTVLLVQNVSMMQ